jgi:hypothetical protein
VFSFVKFLSCTTFRISVIFSRSRKRIHTEIATLTGTYKCSSVQDMFCSLQTQYLPHITSCTKGFFADQTMVVFQYRKTTISVSLRPTDGGKMQLDHCPYSYEQKSYVISFKNKMKMKTLLICIVFFATFRISVIFSRSRKRIHTEIATLTGTYKCSSTVRILWRDYDFRFSARSFMLLQRKSDVW